jgi:hypothetical protein
LVTDPDLIFNLERPAGLPHAVLNLANVSVVVTEILVFVLGNEPVVVAPLIVKPSFGEVISVSVPPEVELGLIVAGVYVPANVGGAAVARPEHELVLPVMVALLLTLVGLGVPPLQWVAEALTVVVSAAVPPVTSGGLKLTVPLILVHFTSPVPVGCERAAEAAPLRATTKPSGSTIAPVASMSFLEKFTCPP